MILPLELIVKVIHVQIIKEMKIGAEFKTHMSSTLARTAAHVLLQNNASQVSANARTSWPSRAPLLGSTTGIRPATA